MVLMAVNSERTFGSYMPLRSCKKVNERSQSSSSHNLFVNILHFFGQNEISEKQVVIGKALLTPVLYVFMLKILVFLYVGAWLTR